MSEQTVYLDNAAATRMDERVLEAMTPYFFETYPVATSEFGYSLGIEAREALEAAREKVAQRLGAGGGELIFTSGSTESSNLALKGVAMALGEKKGSLHRRGFPRPPQRQGAREAGLLRHLSACGFRRTHRSRQPPGRDHR